MKPKNPRRSQTLSLSEQRRVIIVEAIRALADILLEILDAIDTHQPAAAPFIGWELPAASRPRSRDRNERNELCEHLTDDDLDVARRLVDVLPPPKTPGTQYFWAYPLRPVWDKRIRTSRN